MSVGEGGALAQAVKRRQAMEQSKEEQDRAEQKMHGRASEWTG